MRLKYFILLLFVFTVAIAMTSCNKEEAEFGKVEFKFLLKYDGAALVTLDKYNYPMGFQIFFTKFSLFLSDIQLLSDQATIVLKDLIFLNLTENQIDPESAAVGTTVVIDSIPVGLYTQLGINLGVPANLNAMSPSDFVAPHPLANSGEYWEGWSSYIFHKTEGRMDVDGDGEFEEAIALHIGSDAAYRSKILDKTVTINSGETTVINFVIDIKDMYDMGTTPFNLQETPRIHHIGQLPLALPLMDNLIEQFNTN